MANPAKRTVLVIAVIAVVVAPSRAQMSPAARPKFEVASIKLCRPGDAPLGGGRSGANGNDPGRLHLTCQTLDGFIRMAYIRFASVDANGMSTASTRVRNQPIAGEPDWANSERYSIDAKPESPQNLPTMNGPMLQTLLEDRFQLRIRHEAKDVPVYQLVVGRGGPKLTPTTKASCTAVNFSQDAPPEPPKPGEPPFCGPFRRDKNGGIETFGQTLAGLCRQFSAAVDRDVVDRTGLAGEFDIHLDMSDEELFPWERRTSAAPADPPELQPDPLSAITRAVQKLGLRLEPAKASADFLVVDHVARPSEN